MLVVISDVHMTDRSTGSPVTDQELVGFVEDLERLPPEGDMTLLLLGDIFDYLRSGEWGRLFEERPGCAPWSSLGKGFANFVGSHQEKALLGIARAIEAKYSGFSSALKSLKAARKLRIRYVFGNHDYMVQLSPELRTRVVSFLSLDEDPKEPFSRFYEDKALRVYAEHGHRHDPINWHDETQALWAFGDAIVLRLVNRFGELAERELHLTEATPLGRAVHEIDNVEQLMLIPAYVSWLASGLASEADQARLRSCWTRAVGDLLALKEFREPRYGNLGSAIHWLHQLYSLFDLNRLAEVMKTPPAMLTTNYANRAHVELSNALVFVYGHTHEPCVVPLPRVAGEQRYYVNTGTWRRVVEPLPRFDPKDALGFGARRLACHLVVNGPGDFALSTRASTG